MQFSQGFSKRNHWDPWHVNGNNTDSLTILGIKAEIWGSKCSFGDQGKTHPTLTFQGTQNCGKNTTVTCWNFGRDINSFFMHRTLCNLYHWIATQTSVKVIKDSYSCLLFEFQGLVVAQVLCLSVWWCN